ncbi:nucleoside recognition domain-containing protein [uncultured Desulfuromusa sp.]|uniref:nucleoside recognition domain-containing protein n=1 Tax=uncultured Desulfuromusa sp. TaxID=219183 RepID=UPI002AA6F4D6|nr:nucleoside recognition domain-containing protein [uncultured Desulfuromusa sp.]
MSSPGFFPRLKQAVIDLVLEALHASVELFKIIVPISIVTRFLQQWGIVDQLGVLLGPIMELVGLPGQLGLVWATGMVTSIYGGMVVFASVAPGLELSVAQVTVLGSMILVAHGLPVELRIAQKAGTRFRAMALIRIGGALLLGWILHMTYQLSGTLQQANHALWNPETVAPNWSAWAVAELRTMIMIFIIILGLMAFLRILKKLGISDLMTRLLEPVLTVLGMGREAAPITIIGMTLGLSYGGGLIIREAQSGRLNQRDIFSSVALMGLCHSIFEDTLLLMVLGAHISGILWGRLLFSLLVVFLLARLIKVLPASIFDRYLMRRVKRDLSTAEARCC